MLMLSILYEPILHHYGIEEYDYRNHCRTFYSNNIFLEWLLCELIFYHEEKICQMKKKNE